MPNHSNEQNSLRRRDFLRLFSNSAIMLAAGEVLAGCGGGGSGSTTPTPPGASGGTTILSTGGSVSLPNIGAVSFPSGAFSAAQAVTLKSTNDAETAGKFDTITDLFQISQRVSYEVRVNTGQRLPTAPSYDTTLNVPATFLSSLPANSQITVFVQLDQSGDGEGLDQFAPVDATYDATSKTVQLSLSQEAFTNARTTDSSYEAIVTIAAVPDATTKGVHGRGTGPLTDGLNPPLTTPLVVKSSFGPRKLPAARPHRGVDLQAQTPVSVLAAHDGTLVTGRQTLKSGPNKGKDDPTGYGLYAIVKHADGSSTLYAHLSSVDAFVAASGTVKKGQHIATSGATGGANPQLGNGRGPHLHFEYVPGPYRKGDQIDPMPLIQHLSILEPNTPPQMKIGEILQLKANDTVGHSMAEDHTGAPISLDDLQWQSNSAGVVSVDTKGRIYAMSSGTATITATQTSTGNTASVKVTVNAFESASGKWIGRVSWYGNDGKVDGTGYSFNWEIIETSGQLVCNETFGNNGQYHDTLTGTHIETNIVLKAADGTVLTGTLSGSTMSGTAESNRTGIFTAQRQ